MSTSSLVSILSRNLAKTRSLTLLKQLLPYRTMETLPKTDRWQEATQHLDPKQVEFYHKEQLIRVDENDSPLGPISKGESHAIETIKRSVYHRALSLLVFDEQNRFLLTQRASCKITFPDYFTNACCSHPLYNATELEDDGRAIGIKRATIRRSNFELGTRLNENNLKDLKFVNRLAYRAESDGGQWGEAEIDYIFIMKKNLILNPNPEEVRSYRYVTKDEMQDLLQGNSIKITPWVKLLARDFLFKYWDNLDDLDAIAQPGYIINYRDLFKPDQRL